VAVLGLAVLLLAAPAAARAAGRAPGPAVVLVLLVLAAELLPIEYDGPVESGFGRPEGAGEPH
jgi:hypothetical protein